MPRPVSTGTLAKTPLAHLFVYALDKHLTGSFELASKTETATITVVEGKVAKIRTSKAVAYLGPLLYEMGVIDDEQLNASLVDVARKHELHGQILLERGWITQEMLNAALREQTLRKLAHLFAMSSETMFSFHSDTDLLATWGGPTGALVDPFPAIWRGIREYPSEAHVRHVVKRIGSAACRLATTAELARFDLQGDEQTAADALRLSPLTIAELAASQSFGQRRAELLLYCFLITKQVELVNPTVRTDVAPESPISQKVKTARDRPISFVLQAAAPLSVPPDSGRRASSRPPKSLSSRPPSRRDAYSARRQMIRARAQSIHGEDLYQRLGLPMGGAKIGAAEIESAFAALRAEWDPTELPAEMDDVRDDCWVVLAAIADAHARLLEATAAADKSTPEDPSLADLAGTGATTALEGARVCLARNDVERAERLARRALKAEATNSKASGPPLAIVAWIEAMKPELQTPAATRIRIGMLDRAIDCDDSFDDAYYWRGQLHKRLDDHAAALRDFKRAVALNERHMDAIREIRVHEMRASRGGGGGHGHGHGSRGSDGKGKGGSAPRTLTPPSGTRAPATGLFAKLRA